MKVIVTGGMGFIGSHLVKELMKSKIKVITIDNSEQYFDKIDLSYYKKIEYRKKYLLKGSKNYHINLNAPHLVYEILNREKPEYVVHLAALPLANIAIDNRHLAMEGIFNSTYNLLESLTTLKKFKKFVYVSSSMIYGDFKKNPQTEDDTILDPKDIYGSLKACGELLTKAYFKNYKLPINIVRPSAVYGPTDCNRRVLQNFVEHSIAGKKLTIYDGQSTNLDFTYVKDIARAIHDVLLKGKTGDTYNATFGNSRSILDAFEIIKKLNPKTKVEFKKNKENFRPKRGTLDIEKIKKIGFAPKYNLEKGLKEYYNFQKKFINK
tara:strand:+ start:275 stop:1240 length:966 start_codon:yes stop_codon:yes gene_type:complete